MEGTTHPRTRCSRLDLDLLRRNELLQQTLRGGGGGGEGGPALYVIVVCLGRAGVGRGQNEHPKGRFPGIASHAWGIPTGSKNKDAGWEFIKWAMSKDVLNRMTQQHGLGSVTRRSVLEAPAYRQKMIVNGYDLGKIFLDTLAFADQGHMKYRTVHVYPQANAQINQAMGRVVSGQMKAKESFALAQTNTIADLRRAGVRF